jgi:hypothetical protein
LIVIARHLVDREYVYLRFCFVVHAVELATQFVSRVYAETLCKKEFWIVASFSSYLDKAFRIG